MSEADKTKILELEARLRALENKLNGIPDVIETKPNVKVKEKKK
jgi:hypothetical protein